MTAYGQLAVARKPEPPTILRTAPSGPTGTVRPPSASLIIIDGRRVPVIPPFVRADAAGLGLLVMPSIPSARIESSNSASGLLTVEQFAAQFISPELGATGSPATRVVVGPGTKVVVNAAFGAIGRNAAPNAAFGTMAGLSTTVTPKATAWAPFLGIGTATGVIAYPAAFAGLGIPVGDYTQTVRLSELTESTGSATATVVVNGKAVLSAGAAGNGALSAPATPKATATPNRQGNGALSFVTGVDLGARGDGALATTVGVAGLFGAVAGSTARVSFPAAGSATGTLSAAVAVRSAGAFSGAGALISVQRSAAAGSAGALSAITGGPAQFEAVGLLSAATGQTAALIGAGTLTATAIPGFLPSGMTKNGPQTAERTWVTVIGWTANTATYPGSTVVSDGLRAQGTKTGATLTANVAYTGGYSFYNQQARLLVNNNVVATGAVLKAETGTLIVTATTNLAAGDVVTVQVITDVPTYATPFSITAGSTTFVRIT